MSDAPLPIAAVQSYAVNVRDIALTEDEMDPSTVLAGSPQIASVVMSSSYNGNVVRGIWRCTAGTVTDIEEDESEYSLLCL
jgi:uncharacterized cupin superfamily protein